MKRRERAFTLLELLVAMGILVALGTALMVILRGGLAVWTQGEARRESSQLAQTIFATLREDIQSATVYRQALGRSGKVDARMVCDFDSLNIQQDKKTERIIRQRLFLVRTIKAESENPVTGIAGTSLDAAGYVDFHADREEALSQNLRATGGLMEVAYIIGKGQPQTLYRLVRSPVAGPFSLFQFDRLPGRRVDARRDRILTAFQQNLLKLNGVKKIRRDGQRIVLFSDGKYPQDSIFQELETKDWNKKFQDALDAEDLDLVVHEGISNQDLQHTDHDAKLSTWGKPLASDVLFLGFEFWHQYSKAWIVQQEPRFEGRKEHGSLDYWDSTRGMLKPQVDRGQFTLFKGAGSLNDPKDDILPQKVRVTLVVREDPKAGTETSLLTNVDESATEISIATPGRAPKAPGYVLIDNEWIRYSEVRRNTLVVDENGRGARGTTPAAHVSGQSAIFGRQFRTVIVVPGYVEDWSD